MKQKTSQVQYSLKTWLTWKYSIIHVSSVRSDLNHSLKCVFLYSLIDWCWGILMLKLFRAFNRDVSTPKNEIGWWFLSTCCSQTTSSAMIDGEALWWWETVHVRQSCRPYINQRSICHFTEDASSALTRLCLITTAADCWFVWLQPTYVDINTMWLCSRYRDLFDFDQFWSLIPRDFWS